MTSPLLIAAIAVLPALAALIWALLLQRRLARLRDQLERLDVRFGTLQEQVRLELLGMGQRVIDGDRQLNRFNERLEALESARSPAERYGQLGGLQLDPAARGEEPPSPPSMGEAELLALLRRQKE